MSKYDWEFKLMSHQEARTHLERINRLPKKAPCELTGVQFASLVTTLGTVNNGPPVKQAFMLTWPVQKISREKALAVLRECWDREFDVLIPLNAYEFFQTIQALAMA